MVHTWDMMILSYTHNKSVRGVAWGLRLRDNGAAGANGRLFKTNIQRSVVESRSLRQLLPNTYVRRSLPHAVR